MLAIGGAESVGEGVGDTMQLVADDVQSLVIPGTGHWVAEQAPEELLAALTDVPGPLPQAGGFSQLPPSLASQANGPGVPSPGPTARPLGHPPRGPAAC